MSYYKVEKTDRLEGEIKIQGAKNSALPIIIGSILAGDIVSLYNCPDISDVRDLLDLLEKLGATICFFDNMLYIDGTNIKNMPLTREEMSKTRGSILFLGALTARFGQANLSYPGGCNIGKRPIDIHFDGMSALNIYIYDEEDDMIGAYTEEIIASDVNLKFPSVGATENVMLLATKAKGITRIFNAAKEPEIVDLQDFLNKMGAKIKGAGTDCITIEGVEELHGCSYKIMGDRMVAATYMAATAAIGGRVKLNNIKGEYLREEINVLRKMGCYVKYKKKYIIVSREKKSKLRPMIFIESGPYPAFATDAGTCFVAALLMTKGLSVFRETVFENRYTVAEEFEKMGAIIAVAKGKLVVIDGVDKLVGCQVDAKDLRGGAGLVIAGLMAEGTTIINKVQYIKRGYENIVSDLRRLGAKITEEN
ncbi:MAG: UDP-N-acetylglucosamine 1-carboxyvinyltransferase [Lachnospiraceae bacterium]|nr:UDP-N-acetylglucosamine 1-carboxyvinyltransferase [Lachnospiraceae bacterium]